MMGAARKWLLLAAAVLVSVPLAARAETADVTDADRVYRNYTREAATVGAGQVRLEVRGMMLQDEENTSLNLQGFPVRDRLPGGTSNLCSFSVGSTSYSRPCEVTRESGGVFDVLGSYGLGNNGEVGFLVPTYIQKQRLRSLTPVLRDPDDPTSQFFPEGTSDNADVGDAQLYLKFKRPVAQHCSVAGGLELTLPTGIERKGFGTGEAGFNPFVSTRYQYGRFGLGAHLGYQVFTGDINDVLNYSVEAFWRFSPLYAFRAELSGRRFDANSKNFHDVAVLPGIEFNLAENFTLRPTGLVGVTDEALDWGIGLGVAYTFGVSLPAPQAAPSPAPPPPPPAPAAAPVAIKRKIVLRGVNFDFDKSNIRPDAQATLDEAVSTLKEVSSIAIAVEGHTDSDGTDEYNNALSMRRAVSVRDYLADHGIERSRMSVEGFGESKPVATNDTADGRAQNRRVELRVTQQPE